MQQVHGVKYWEFINNESNRTQVRELRVGETQLKQTVERNAHLGFTVLIYVKRGIKSPPGKIISIYISFSCVSLELQFLHPTEVLRGLVLKCVTKHWLEQQECLEITHSACERACGLGHGRDSGLILVSSTSHGQVPWPPSMSHQQEKYHRTYLVGL